MLHALSIQSDVLGNRTYCETLRRSFAGYPDVDLTSCWYSEGRPAWVKLVNKAARLRVLPGTRNLDMRRARAEWGYGLIARQLAQRQLAARHFDVLHFHSQIQAFASVDLLRRIPTVVSMDMTAFQIAREAAPRDRWTHKPSIAMERRVLQAAAQVVTMSQWARRSVVEEHGIPAEKVTAILPGTRLDTFRPPDFAVKSRPRILFVGGDFQRKGGWDLLRVFSENFSNTATLDLVTSQSFQELPSQVQVHHGVAAFSSRWHDLFRNADIFVMPSYAEALGHVFQEAGGYGLALIGSSVGAVSEMVHDEENGFLVTAGDLPQLTQRLHALLSDPALLQQMRRRSFEIAQAEFNAAVNFRRMADVFYKAADTAPARPRS